MYSKNDYRYYLEHRLAESDDYLAHYGVKGMKWKHHSVQEDIAKDVLQKELAKRNAGVPAQKTSSAAKTIGNAIPTKKERRKKRRKNAISNFRKKYGLYRETPKGKKLKGSKNIYVSYD